MSPTTCALNSRARAGNSPVVENNKEAQFAVTASAGSFQATTAEASPPLSAQFRIRFRLKKKGLYQMASHGIWGATGNGLRALWQLIATKELRHYLLFCWKPLGQTRHPSKTMVSP
ncbi:MAG: hypothetical protein ACNI3A_10480 [Desulfovibrio sp.]|uniref:hypothetical protein n=1 Tax=Desulfovibrio sp. 7SRBS1 TaxID=3378064 RepID=UPI003B40B022